MFRLGLCMPSSCSEYDVQDLINLATKDVDFPANVKRCESKSDFEYQSHEFIILSILALFLAIIVIATIINICFDCMSPDKPDQNAKCAKTFGLFSRLSLCQSIPKLLECNVDGDAFDVIRGMKVLTVFFAIYMHTYGLPHPLHLYRFRDTLNLSKFMNDILFETIANASVGVDTIFFLAGFICIYNRWRQLKRPGVILYILKFIFLNYIRMVALQVLVICLFFLTPILGSGPLWQEFVEEPLNNCSEKWWMNLLFIQNFLGPYDSCLYHTWVLAAMMQIFVATTVVVWLMNRWPVLGILSNVFLILLTIVAVASVTAIFDYPATFAIYFYDYRVSKHMWKNLYVQSYTHMGPYCIGMLVAYFVAENSPRKIQKHVSFFLWLASFVTCSAIIFGLHPYHDGRPMERGLAIFYAAVHRPSWALAIGWIVYACATGHGGVVNSFLSWKFFVPLERLCYMAYLLHVPLMYYQGGIQRERVYMGHYNQMMSFLSYAVTSFILSFICYLIFQVPYEVLEGFIFRKQGGSIWQVDPSASSEEALEDAEKTSDNGSSTEDNSKVLYNRSSQCDKF
ncbi:nose resistant to fluoxetine protein 6-like [Stegodyphus dumicola]|uniref:nose resistant to fluoxetine protein 6-like n=1 Tax=Stegodyphus dumicola TaxID=202533 RepID=UPI0015B35013|nr:nose resistant to fluoxetine protein 6-like [Stegodyphus dumicola]